MAQIGVNLDYPTNYDQTWAPACNVDVDAQYLLHGQPSDMMVIDSEFLAPMLTPILAGQIKMINCDAGEPITAVYDEPRYYASLPQKSTKCGPGRTCGDVVSTLSGPELYQATVEETSMPVFDEMCGPGGCGAHPKAGEVNGVDKLTQAMFDNFSNIIDIRFMKYVYSPVKDNLAVASVTSAPTISITTPTGAKTVVDYVTLREDWETALVTALDVADDALAMGYNEAILPTTISEADLQAEAICCLDGEGLRRAVGFIQAKVTEAFKTGGSRGNMLIVANYKDVPYATLREMQQSAYLGSTMADPFALKGLENGPMVMSEHEAYDLGQGNVLVLSYMAPEGKVLFLPEQVRQNINFAQSEFKTKMNPASSCDWEEWFLAKKAFSWYIPEVYRDKYYIVDLPADCKTLETCPAP